MGNLEVVKTLNQRPLSRHVTTLLTASGVSVEAHSLALMQLLEWTVEHQPWPEADMELGALSAWEQANPKRAYALLSGESAKETLAGPLLAAETLPELADALEGMLADWLDDRSVHPPERRAIPLP
jgi:hypothetical protein